MDSTEADELKLIVIEDEALIALELEWMLQDLGHRVLAVGATVDQALALLEMHAGEADVVLLDANLRGASAVPVAEALKERGVPFILASGYEREELERFGFREGRVVGKPYSAEDLATALSALRPRQASIGAPTPQD